MAIIDARILRSLTVSERKSDKGTRQLSGTEEFLVLSDAKDPSFGEILDNAATFANLGNRRLPKINDTIQLGGKRFYVTNRDLAHFKDNERAVKMTVRYDSKAEEDDDPPDPPDGTDPETWQRITVTSQQMTKPAIGWPSRGAVPGENNDDEGLNARNSAGDPVDGLEEDVAMVKLVYTNTQVLSPDFSELQRYTNRCNDGGFLGGADYTVRMVGWNAEYDQKNNTWSVSVEFLYNPDGWQIEYFDAGFNEIDGSERKAILDSVGNPVSSPVPLDGNGSALAISYPPAEPVKLELYPYKIADMSALFFNCRI
jgi:hypothetical protein